MNPLLRIVLPACIACSCFPATAQIPPDSVQYNQVLKNLSLVFEKNMKDNSNLYNGAEYIGYDRNIVGHQFLLSDKFIPGNILYSDVMYENVPMLYDVVKDEIVINLYKRDFRIKLLNEKIDFFVIGGRHFERIGSGGFFEVLSDREPMVLAKRSKKIITSLNTEEPSRFISVDRFFITRQNKIYAVDSRNSLLKALDDKKAAIKSFIEKNNLDFKKDFEVSIIKVTAYYSTLKN